MNNSAEEKNNVSRRDFIKTSDLDLTPEKYDFAYDMPMRPIAVPGKTQLT